MRTSTTDTLAATYWPATRKPDATYAVIALIAAMLAVTVGCMLYTSEMRDRQNEVRVEARLTRQTRLALFEVDTTVLRFLTNPDERPDPVAYGKAVSRLEALGLDRFPKTVKRGGADAPATAVLASLKSAWDDMVGQLDAKAPDAAREIYLARAVERDMNAFQASFSTTLDGYEAQYVEYQSEIDAAAWASLAGQLLTGLVSILAFLVAARTGARESRARSAAVDRADATREQVLRLFEMTDMLQSASDHADANAVLRATAAELLPDLGGALYVFNNSRDRLTLSTHWAMSDEHLVEAIGLQQCWALKRGKPHVNRPDTHKLCCEHHVGADFALEIPMIARGEILGLMQFHASGETAEERLAEIAGVATALSDAMSLALANLGLRDKLRSQALRDPLTGLYNRRYMEDTLDRLVKLGGRERRDVSLIMIDLDHFKQLNDRHGHAKGDAVLRDASSLIIANLRQSDVACRYGGEELLVILPQCGLDMAAKKAEQLRIAIEGLSEPNGAQVSASFGVACVPTTSGASRELLAAADAALYRAKQDGRNRVVAAPRRATGASEEELLAELQAAE